MPPYRGRATGRPRFSYRGLLLSVDKIPTVLRGRYARELTEKSLLQTTMLLYIALHKRIWVEICSGGHTELYWNPTELRPGEGARLALFLTKTKNKIKKTLRLI